MEFNAQNQEQTTKELEIEYIQAISDSDSLTMTASVRNSEAMPPNPKKSKSTMQTPHSGKFLEVKG